MGVRPVSGSVLDARISGRRRRSIGRGTTTMWPLLLRTRGKTSWPSIGRRDPMPSVSRRQPPTGAHRPGAGSRSANLIDCFPPRWPTCRSLLVDRPHSWPSGGDARAVPIHAPEERAHGAYYERALATAMRDEQQSLLARRRRLRWTIFDSRRHASPQPEVVHGGRLAWTANVLAFALEGSDLIIAAGRVCDDHHALTGSKDADARPRAGDCGSHRSSAHVASGSRGRGRA
jgi:hypothetical protein